MSNGLIEAPHPCSAAAVKPLAGWKTLAQRKARRSVSYSYS